MKRQLPKNVRQIGNVSDSPKIYLEDYVDTFFNQLCDKAEQSPAGAFLVGERTREEEEDCVFVYGAIRMDEIHVKGQDIQIGDNVWKNACEKCKEYFGDAELLGWFLAVPDQPMEANPNLRRIHEKFFPKDRGIFVLKNAADREERFYIHRYQSLMECGGHYIYYEKNPEMQNYMIASRKKSGAAAAEVIEDKAAKDFRSVIKDKMEKNEEKSGSRFIYAASTFLVLVVFVIGITMINNYDKMQGVQRSLDTISESVSTPDDKKDKPEKTDGEGEMAAREMTVQEDIMASQNDVEIVGDDVYVVEKGDTLATISRKVYGDTSHVEAICKMNGLEDGNLIFIGQKLLLPQ